MGSKTIVGTSNHCNQLRDSISRSTQTDILDIYNKIVVARTFCNERKKKFYIGEYKLIAEIGSGKFATVALVKHRKTKEQYAMKIILKTPNRAKKIKTETLIHEMLMKNKNRFIVDFYTTFHTNGHICHVIEYLECGNLMQHLKVSNFSEARAKFYIACMLIALNHIHSMNIAHKDIKPQNMVVNKKGYVKLVDFGHAQINVTYSTPMFDKLGTKHYKAPEYFEQGPIWRFVDFWALAVSLHIMIVGRHIEQSEEGVTIEKRALSEPCQDLLELIFVRDPFARLGSGRRGAQEIMEHYFFKDFDWEALENGSMSAPKPKSSISSKTSPNVLYANVSSIEDFVIIDN